MKAVIPVIGIAILFFLSCNPPDTPEPVIQKIVPESGPPGSDFTIVGHNLHYVNTVFLDTYSLNFVVLDNDTLIAKVPRDIPLDSYFVYATYNSGKSKAFPFAVIKPQPFIENLYPLSARANDTLAITGNSLEGNNLEVHIADLVTEQFLWVTDTLILLKVTENFKTGELTVVNSNGTSNSKYFNFLGDIPDDDYKPIVLNIYPSQGIPGGEIRITGKNFTRENLHIVFPLQIELSENTDFVVLSDTLLVITIPDGGLTGAITIENTFGTVYSNIEVVPAPVITRILPAGNKAGGPMLIYGRDLNHVNSLRFGDNPLINQFNYFTTNENEEIIALRVPGITPGILEVRAEINESMFSNAITYNLYPGTMSLPEYMPTIVIPNTPFASIADGINNDWISMNDSTSTITLELDFSDRTVILGNGDPIGTVNVDDNSIILNNAYGKLDKSYYTPDQDISRLILTPLDSGNQYEMITPFYLESVEPVSVSPGGELSVKARYFIPGRWSVDIDDNDSYFVTFFEEDTAVKVISFNLIKIKLSDFIPPGEYDLRVNSSNIKKFSVVSK